MNLYPNRYPIKEEGEGEWRLNCQLCGESIGRAPLNDPDFWEYDTEVGEFYNPTKPEEDSVVAHAQCGIDAKMEIA